MAKKIGPTKVGARGLVGAVIGVSIGLVIAMAVLPIALSDAAGAEAANWGASGVVILGLFVIVAAAGLIYYMLSAFDIL